MFVPVACLKCGKLFQVPPPAAGTDVPCPWCRATTPALPVAGVTVPPPAPAPTQPAAQDPGPTGPHPEPLSLDDDPAPPPPATARLAPSGVPPWVVRLVVGLVVMVVVASATFAVLRVGRVFGPDWAEFTPPDGSCTVLMPARPAAEEVGPNPHSPALRGGHRFVARRWYLRFETSFGWQDVDPERVKLVRVEDLAGAEVERRKADLGATAGVPAPYRSNEFHGVEVHYDTPAGKRVELMILVPDGPRPRLYVLAVEGKEIGPDSAAVRRFFTSFRVRKD